MDSSQYLDSYYNWLMDPVALPATSPPPPLHPAPVRMTKLPRSSYQRRREEWAQEARRRNIGDASDFVRWLADEFRPSNRKDRVLAQGMAAVISPGPATKPVQ